MNDPQVPLRLNEVDDSIYASFWARFGSVLLDSVLVLPVAVVAMYLNSLGKNVYFYTILPHLAFTFWFNIYLPKKYGATPGKSTVGIRIIRMDGQPIGWKEAILRHAILLFLTLLSGVMMIYCLSQADEEEFAKLPWLKQTEYLMTFAPVFFLVYTWISNLWVYSEFVVLLTNKRKRAIHDFIAGTVIVKEKYLDQIRAAMDVSETHFDDPATENPRPKFTD